MEKRQCRKCGQLHEIAYIIHKNGMKHLILLHPTNSGHRADVYIPYEANLDIRTVLTKAQQYKGIEHRGNSPIPKASMPVMDETSLFPSIK